MATQTDNGDGTATLSGTGAAANLDDADSDRIHILHDL